MPIFHVMHDQAQLVLKKNKDGNNEILATKGYEMLRQWPELKLCYT